MGLLFLHIRFAQGSVAKDVSINVANFFIVVEIPLKKLNDQNKIKHFKSYKSFVRINTPPIPNIA